MKLSDLIPGYHTVQTKDGRLWLVLLTRDHKMCFSRQDSWLATDNYTGFKHNLYNSYNIVKIFCPRRSSNEIPDRFEASGLELEGNGPEVELTVDQVSELLGYKVKIIGDK